MKRTMRLMNLEHAGFVARPLYACTKRIEGGHMCMNVASMSKYIKHGDGRSHYRCTKCKQTECFESASVSNDIPLRVLDLYILVCDGKKTTFMRSKPYRLCVRTPPSQWRFGVELGQLPSLIQAIPNFVSYGQGKFYEYNEDESKAIWCYSSSYAGKPSS